MRVFLQHTISQKEVDKSHIAAWTVPIAGGISGAWAWFVSFPLDCIKVRSGVKYREKLVTRLVLINSKKRKHSCLRYKK
jgi:hypothetical protein